MPCTCRGATRPRPSGGSCRCTRTSGPRSTRFVPAISRPPSISRTSRQATASRNPTSPITLEMMDFPEPVIAAAIEPKTAADHALLNDALAKLVREDPTLRVHVDAESGQTILRGMGELHLEIVVDRMLREFGVVANVGRPQVAYRETIRKAVEQDGKFARQAGGRDQYARSFAAARAVAVGPRLRVRRRQSPGGAFPPRRAGRRRRRARADGGRRDRGLSRRRRQSHAARRRARAGSNRARRRSSWPAPRLSRKACARRGRRCSSRS